MSYIKIVNLDEKYNGTITPITDDVVQVNNVPKSLNGLCLYNDKNDKLIGDYSLYKTLYREIDKENNIYQYSKNGSVYVQPKCKITFDVKSGGSLEGETEQFVSDYKDLVIPTPIADKNYEFIGWKPEIPESGIVDINKTFVAKFSYIPTLEETKENKVVEMNNIQQSIIRYGVDVELSDGTIEHFTLTEHDQTSLMGLKTKVVEGENNIPWHTSDQEEHCKYYSNEDMALIVDKALNFITYHVTYFRDLRIYIRSLESKEDVNAITYGVELPVEYQSEVLKDILSKLATMAETGE